MEYLYKAVDGKIFTDEAECEKHEGGLLLVQKAEDTLGITIINIKRSLDYCKDNPELLNWALPDWELKKKEAGNQKGAPILEFGWILQFKGEEFACFGPMLTSIRHVKTLEQATFLPEPKPPAAFSQLLRRDVRFLEVIRSTKVRTTGGVIRT